MYVMRVILLYFSFKKDESFKSFMQEVTQIKFREIMHLLPSGQRTVARFMNLSETVSWASRMLKSFSRLNEEEEKIFHSIPSNRLLIEELNKVFLSVNSILQRLKNEGISQVSAKECLPELRDKK